MSFEPGRAIIFLLAKRMEGMASAHQFGRKVIVKLFEMRQIQTLSMLPTRWEHVGEEDKVSMEAEVAKTEQQTNEPPEASNRTDSFGFPCR